MSSRKEIVQKVNDAFAAGKPEGFLDLCAEDVEWTVEGENTASGKAAVREWVSTMEGCEPPRFTADKMVEEGDTVVCYGDMTMTAEGKESNYSYCDIYGFSGDEIKTLRTFVVKQK